MTTPLKDAASWSLAARLVRMFPEWRVFHTHPGGGQYDCLFLVDRVQQPTVRFTINRSGSIHVDHDSDGGSEHVVNQQWFDSLAMGTSVQEVVERVLRAVQLQMPAQTPPSSRWSVTYRVLAQIVASTVTTSHPLTATTWFYDSAGGDEGLLMDCPYRELQGVNPSDVWLIMDDDSAVAWVWDGWVWTATGERLDVYGRYRAGSSVAALASLVVDQSRGGPERPPAWLAG